MSGEQRRPGAPQSGSPWSPELVADLHAGALDEDTADELLPLLDTDPQARDLLAALDATTAELAELPTPTMPDDVAARLDGALADELRYWSASYDSPVAAPPEPPGAEHGHIVDLDIARQRRRRRAGWGAGLVTAAAAVTGVVALSTGLLSTNATQQAGDMPNTTTPAESPPLALTGDSPTLPPGQLAQAIGSKQYGALADPQQLLGCLQANRVTSGNPLGAREVTIDGEPARLLVLPGGELGRFRLLVVGPDCGPQRPATISDTTLGG